MVRFGGGIGWVCVCFFFFFFWFVDVDGGGRREGGRGLDGVRDGGGWGGRRG